MDLKDKIRNIQDFPKKGIVFRDITTLIQDPEVFQYIVDNFKNEFSNSEIDVIVGVEPRGLRIITAHAYAMGIPFTMVRKPGKLPSSIVYEEYELEYGTDRLEVHDDAVKEGDKVLIVDDLLATGGTSRATANLIEKIGGELVAFAFVIELSFLNGREKLKDYKIYSLVDYKSD
jgi:adenine phosphoribosyltransferase